MYQNGADKVNVLKVKSRLVGRDVGRAAAIAGGGLCSLDVQVEQLHLSKETSAHLGTGMRPAHLLPSAFFHMSQSSGAVCVGW